VNVTHTGPYEITTDSTDGVIFTGIGNFTTTGNQTVTLTGSGVPAAGGSYTVLPTCASNYCSFTMNVQ
jgi:hypothetical protein